LRIILTALLENIVVPSVLINQKNIVLSLSNMTDPLNTARATAERKAEEVVNSLINGRCPQK